MENKINIQKYIFCFIIISTISFGCTPQTKYEWGKYEDYIYKKYLKPGSIPINDEILALEDQIKYTYNKNRLIPPGLHAHLGYLYVATGNYKMAVIHFNKEKEKFPESSHFIDGLIKRMQK